ncbi:MFS transporter TsgA [Buchnera aphidicola]|uniref:MFS transporter TsgA n=1 Tax=Buchnera aphidicola TaxID=9 RepID=UPI0034647EF0
MKNINQTGLTWISFFSYAFTGALIVVTGMIMGNIANYFHISISEMSNIFTFLNAGILISIVFNSWLMKIVSLKIQIIFGFILTIIAILGILYSHSILLFSINLFILGMVSGMTMSIGTFIITNLYSGSKRGSKLLITDSFFSMSGMIFPIITAYLLEKNILWYWIYVLIGSIYAFITILALNLKFPILKKENHHESKNTEKWGLNIFLLSMAALFYILGQLGFISWIPQYTTEIMNINMQHAAHLVSNFWMSYMIGMWFFSFIIMFFHLNHIFIFLTGMSTILMYYFIQSTSYLILEYMIIGLGFFSSAIYTIIITLASLQTEKPSPPIINTILVCGTVGTLLTFVITSPIVQKYGLYITLMSTNVFYAIVFFLSILIYLNNLLLRKM